MTRLAFDFSRTHVFRTAASASGVALLATLVACSSGSDANGAAGASAVAGSPSSAGASAGNASSGAPSAAGETSAGGTSAGASSAGAGGSGAGAGGVSAGAGGSSGSAGGGVSHAADAAFCKAALDSAAADYKGFIATYTDPTKIPRAYGPALATVGLYDWTSGFDAGTLWLLYEHSKDAAYKAAAEKWTNALYVLRNRTDDHDVGFQIMSSYGNGYRITNNPDYKAVIVTAAGSLNTRFNAKVGCTRSWNDATWQFPVIIDNMMNMELLYRGTELGGNAAYKQSAITHAMTTKKNHFRDDFSSFHLVDYNPTTGVVIKKQTVQGIADSSAWARGQTWGLYGFTMSYRESKDPSFLTHAVNIAEFYTKHANFPEDNVPLFDFATFELADVPDYRDASAGAIAAGGLLELARYVPAEAAERYRVFAVKALRSLASPAYRAAAGTNGQFLLKHSVGNYPAKSEIDVAINYADYYFVEALQRCAALE